jgi:hypothetical protein
MPLFGWCGQAVRQSCGRSRARDASPAAVLRVFGAKIWSVAYFADLTPYSYWPADGSVNVGWLSLSHPFKTGLVDAPVVDSILRLVRDHPVNRTRGWHRCELCAEPAHPLAMCADGTQVYLGDCEIRIGGMGQNIYAAPSLVAHYMADHRYLPPQGFIDAALRHSP